MNSGGTPITKRCLNCAALGPQSQKNIKDVNYKTLVSFVERGFKPDSSPARGTDVPVFIRALPQKDTFQFLRDSKRIRDFK
jgi:hypothetical protein